MHYYLFTAELKDENITTKYTGLVLASDYEDAENKVYNRYNDDEQQLSINIHPLILD